MFGKKKPEKADRLRDRMKAIDNRAHEAPPAIFKNGALKLPTGEVIAVVITALDATSARVELAVRQELPPQVLLIEHSLKLRVAATVIWQRDSAAALALGN